MYSFLIDDKDSRLDTNQSLVELIQQWSGKKIVNHKRVWLIISKGSWLLSIITFPLSGEAVNALVQVSGICSGLEWGKDHTKTTSKINCSMQHVEVDKDTLKCFSCILPGKYCVLSTSTQNSVLSHSVFIQEMHTK